MPWRLAFALQADGWYLRSDIIWFKPNPMPESVTDRPTKAHEYLFLLAKSERYHYDGDAIREPQKYGIPNAPDKIKSPYGQGFTRRAGGVSAEGYDERKWLDRHDGKSRPPMTMNDREYDDRGRNRRSVWTIATQPFPGAHFATFPQKLIEPCIKAGTGLMGCCPVCGAPWSRAVDREFVPQADVSKEKGVRAHGGQKPMDASSTWSGSSRGTVRSTTTGWHPACDCRSADPVPCAVLDPFAGSGTTGLVALQLGCRFVGIELSSEYIKTLLQPRLEKAEEQGRLF